MSWCKKLNKWVGVKTSPIVPIKIKIKNLRAGVNWLRIMSANKIKLKGNKQQHIFPLTTINVKSKKVKIKWQLKVESREIRGDVETKPPDSRDFKKLVKKDVPAT